MARTAVVAGATGLIGGSLVQKLSAEPAWTRIIALVRRPLGFSLPHVDEQTAAFEALDSLSPSTVDDVFCALGTTIAKAGSQEAFRKIDYEYPLALARWANSRGARRYLLVSSVGADPRGGNFYLRVKGELEDALERLPIETLHIFRPSLLLGPRSESRPTERIAQAVMPAMSFLFAGPLRRYRAIDAGTVAGAMVRAALAPVTGRHVYHWDEMTQRP
jgi:uncharacterized protein YbjT (DUF2867 family)